MTKVTLFGLAGTGKSTVSKLFAERNNYIYMSTGNIFRQMAKERNMDVYEFNNYCRSHPELDNELDNKVKEFGLKNDNFIFESRLAWFFIPDSIKVKIDCDFEVRVKRVAQRDGVDIDIIRNKTKDREGNEKRYDDLYGIKDYTNDSHFDLLIDTTSLTPEEICIIIEKFIYKKNK